LKNQYATKGIKLLITAFENIEYPVRLNLDAKKCGEKLANFITTYNLDGADISFQDSYSFTTGAAEQWLTTFTNSLKGQLTSDKIIVHTTPAAHFKS
jgi:chitinase